MGSSQETFDDSGWAPLHIEARKGNLKEVRGLLDEGADVNVRVLGSKSYGATPLHFASVGGHLKVMDELLERGAEIDARTKGGVCGWTSLHFAAKEPRNKKAMKFLIQNGAFLPTDIADLRFNPDLYYCPGLEWAYQFKMRTEGTFRSSSTHGTSCSEDDFKTGMEATVISSSTHEISDRTQPLESRHLMDSFQKTVDDRGWTPLHIEARSGNLKQVRRLLDEGADVNVAVLGPKYYGATPLHFASAGGHVKVMDELLQRGADIDARTNGGACGWTPLHFAAKEPRNKKAMIFLIQNGAFLPIDIADLRLNPDIYYCPGLEWAYSFKMRMEEILKSSSTLGISSSEDTSSECGI